MKCRVNGQEVELEADIKPLPRVEDKRAPSPTITFPDPEELCRKYRAFLERVDGLIREALEDPGPLTKARQSLPGRWDFYYPNLKWGSVGVELEGLTEQEVGQGKDKPVFSEDIAMLRFIPEGWPGPGA